MHESPSGIDNSVCTYGSMIEYRAEEPIFMLQVPKMKILLVDSKVSRNTKDQVKRVEQLRKYYPTIIEPILHSIDGVSQMARNVFKKMHETPENDEDGWQSSYEELKTLIFINQKLLSALTVSHPKLDTICADAQNLFLAGKLTGAGGGGFAYILLPPHKKEEKNQEALTRILKEKGFDVIETVLGGEGVKIDK
ncbi:Mevalonate kinase [Ooceraea biroi]|nr:Mevalonate kinase [Ooceraea biroi]